jgi:hypothetical protein
MKESYCYYYILIYTMNRVKVFKIRKWKKVIMRFKIRKYIKSIVSVPKINYIVYSRVMNYSSRVLISEFSLTYIEVCCMHKIYQIIYTNNYNSLMILLL